jgi:hypothetical protein
MGAVQPLCSANPVPSIWGRKIGSTFYRAIWLKLSFLPSEMRIKSGRWIQTYLITLLIPPFAARAETGSDLWTSVDMTYFEKGAFRAHLFLHQLAEEGRGPVVQLVSPRLKYKVQPWLELGAGFSILRLENSVSEDFSNQCRPEIELNPTLRMGESWKLGVRNRFEVRWNEGGGKPRPRSRHRLQLTRTIAGAGPLTAIFASNEFLFEYDRGEWTENRIVPGGATLRLSKWASMDLFYMVRSTQADRTWSHDHIAGVILKLTL